MHIPLPPSPRILLIRLSAVGDIANCLPAAAALKARFPAASLAWAADERTRPLLEACPDVDEILSFPRSPRDGASLAVRLAFFFRDLRARSFDAAIDLHGNARSGLVSWCSGAPVRLGFSRETSREGNQIFSTHRVSPPPGTRHRTLRSLALLEPLGIPPDPPGSKLVPSEASCRTARAWLDRHTPGPGRFLVLHPGASAKGTYKRWPAERFAKLAAALMQEGFAVVLFKGPGEDSIIREASRGLPPDIPVTPAWSLVEALAFLAAARLVIGSDSGPVHLAAACGTPAVVIFGPKDPAQYSPLAAAHRAVYRALPCSPCRRLDCPHRRCLDLVSVEEVLDNVRKALAPS